VFRLHATYHWKDLKEGYNFASNLITIEGFHAKLWAPKVAKVLTVGIPGLPFESLGTKCHLDVAPWRGAENTIRGKVVASFKSKPW
jgi:hypothetical protein